MQNDPDEIHVSAEDARGGSTPGIMRYVLGISLILAILALTAIWVTGAFNADQGNSAQNSTHRTIMEENPKG